ncbi:MAG: class I SAM-dependent methyltransferase [Cyclobacteriaceae bacterium]|nr:class I SAM-dependent methyltransferase [Cyclobacteriaceae bacterium]
MATEQDLEELASQLRQPTGKKGVEIADMMNETNIRMTYHSISQLNVADGNVILELGHGNGGHLSFLLDKAKNLVYHGLEISGLMHQEAQSINNTFVTTRQAYFHLYDGVAIPFSENTFDRIFTVNTIYFWSNPEVLLSELYRVLKPTGIAAITFAQKSFMEQLPFTQFGFELYDNEKLTRLVSTTAFKILDTDTQTEYIKSKTGEMVNRAFTTFALQK